MRAFIAIELPDDVKKAITDLQEQIGNSDFKINWVKPEHQHLTLKFLGEVSERQAEEIKNRLEEVKVKSFTAAIKNIGFFPNDNYIRVVWVYVNGKVLELQQAIDIKLADMFEKEKDYKPHVTLGRVKFVKDRVKLKEKLKLKFEKSFAVEGFALFKSTLTSKGPIHERLALFK